MVSYDTFSGGLFIGRVVLTTTKVGRGNKITTLRRGGNPLPKNLGFRV
jgi:hypothetical protein